MLWFSIEHAERLTSEQTSNIFSQNAKSYCDICLVRQISGMLKPNSRKLKLKAVKGSVSIKIKLSNSI